MSDKTVKIYSTPTCVYCRMAKQYFNENKVAYEDINVASDAKAREYIVKRTGQMGVPVIEVGNEVVIGFDEEKLGELLHIS
jgi:glutaredoxin 3